MELLKKHPYWLRCAIYFIISFLWIELISLITLFIVNYFESENLKLGAFTIFLVFVAMPVLFYLNYKVGRNLFWRGQVETSLTKKKISEKRELAVIALSTLGFYIFSYMTVLYTFLNFGINNFWHHSFFMFLNGIAIAWYIGSPKEGDKYIKN